jgi:hypothetical protein
VRATALAVLAGCAAPAPSVASARATPTPIDAARPPPPSWIDRCELRLRSASEPLVRAGLPGPMLVQRERASDWGANDYDAFITAAATNWSLFPDPPRLDPEATPSDGLVFALGRSMKFRVVLIPIACSPRAARIEPWQDKQKYWDADESYEQAHGVSATIHTDPTMPELAVRFVDTMRPVVDACVADRPEVAPERTCDPEPG